MLSFLIIVSLIGIAAIVNQIRHQRICPTDATIEDYLTNKIKKTSDEGRRVTAHLGICKICRAKVEGFWENH